MNTGARGLAHIGVLKILDKEKIRITSITGCSMGAIVGGLYAYFKNAAEVEDFVLKAIKDSSFEKLGIDKKYPSVDLIEYNRNMLDYLKGKQPIPAEIALNQRELSHMHDVKEVFSLFLILFYSLLLAVGILLIINYKINKTHLRKIFHYAGIISLIFSFILLIFFSFSFNSSFTAFHKLFFKENTWLFYPEDNIVNIYPTELSLYISVNIFLLTIMISVLFIIFKYTWGKQKSCVR